jgi:hypothetical protein
MEREMERMAQQETPPRDLTRATLAASVTVLLPLVAAFTGVVLKSANPSDVDVTHGSAAAGGGAGGKVVLGFALIAPQGAMDSVG